MTDTDADKRRDQVLKRMLQTPPKPHKPAKGEDKAGDPALREAPGEHGFAPPIEGGKTVTDSA